MPQVSIRAEEFDEPNIWTVSNRSTEIAFDWDELLHAAATAGHDNDWRLVLGAQFGGLHEILWKIHALLLCVREDAFCRQNNRAHYVDRFVSTERFWGLDPSEKRGSTYHLGMLFAVAWARKILNVPWLLHIDVYRTRLDPAFQPGNSRPDLIGRDTNGRWIIIECKGRASAPNQNAIDKAKTQSERVLTVGGQVPILHVAFFSYFSPDRTAAGRSKPKVLNGLAVDPEPSGVPDDPLDLPLLTDREFFRLYYEPFAELFLGEGRVQERDGYKWRTLEGFDMTLGVVDEIYSLLESEQYTEIPLVLKESSRFAPGRINNQDHQDGLSVRAGNRLKAQFKTER